jgi:hypothetical protein
MSAPVIELAEAIKESLNAWTPSLQAERRWQLYTELATLGTRKIVVYPRADDTDGKVDRSRWSHSLRIHIAVQQRIEADANTETDALVTLADSICERVKTHPPSGPWKLMAATVIPLLQNEAMQRNKIFASLADLTFTQHR